MGRYRIAVVLLLLICLPMKVVAAVAMPFCGVPAAAMAVHQEHGGDADGDDGDGDGHGGHADHGATAGHSAESAPAPSSGADCGQCGLCHLACASAIPVEIATVTIRFMPVLCATFPAAFVSFIPEVLFRPPLRSSLTALA